MAETIGFYYTTDSFDTINKTLTVIGNVSNTYFLRDTSLLNPELDIETALNISNANMFSFDGYYYSITECQMIKGGLYRIAGKLDPYTYQEVVLNAHCLVERTSDTNIINKNIPNPDKVSETRTFDTICNFVGTETFLDTPALILSTIASNNPKTYTDPDFEHDLVYGAYITLCNLLGVAPNWFTREEGE